MQGATQVLYFTFTFYVLTDNGRTARKHNAFATYCWRRRDN